MILSPRVWMREVVPCWGTMLNPLVFVHASTNGSTVIRAFGVWLAPMPSVEFAGVTKSTWYNQPLTVVKVVGLLAGLSTARSISSRPAGGGVPVRKFEASTGRA